MSSKKVILNFEENGSPTPGSQKRDLKVDSSYKSVNRSGRESPTSSNQGSLRTSLRKLSQEKRAKKLRFYRNGDRFFTGLIYALSLERTRTWDSLLEDLTRILVNQVNLPMGVRYIFTIDGKDKIVSLDQFKEGESYVCSSNDHFNKLDYAKSTRPQWCLTRKLVDSLSTSKSDWAMLWRNAIREPRSFIKPKIVTIIKNGVKPRKAIRMVLNKKTAYSFEQVLNDVTKQVKLDTGAVRKLFSLGGHQVTCLADFFRDEDIFIAYGHEKLSTDDFDLDSEESKLLNVTCIRYHGSQKKSRLTSRRRSSPAFVNSDSPYSSSQSSLGSSPKLTRKIRAKSPTKTKYNENGFSHYNSHGIPTEVSEKYELGRIIGDGNFAVVHECNERATKQEFAIKIIDKEKCRGKEHLIASEVAILRRVHHPNIVQLFEEFDIGSQLFLIMELVKGGDLFDSIASESKYSERDASLMIYDLASALHYLHSMNIIHRDIKPENLLVVTHDDGTKSLKLGDFGLAVEATEYLYTLCGTPTYVAPEILSESGYGTKVDVWACGVITYILLCGFPPFVNATNDQEELFTQILSGNYEFPSPYWDEISNLAKEFIVGMLQVEPALRLSSSQMLEHSWLKNHMSSNMSLKLSMHFECKPATGLALLTVTSS